MKNKFISGVLALLFSVGGLSACDFMGGFDSSENSHSSGRGESVSIQASESSQNGSSKADSEESVSSSNSVSQESVESAESAPNSSEDSAEDGSESSMNSSVEVVNDEFSIHFLYFDNAVSGDCTLVKVGDTEVLIDAGSTTGSAKTIIPYIQKYCTDGVLEYVIATHAHSDHIAAFVGSEGMGIFSAFECRTIIDYTAKNTNSDISEQYEAMRDAEVALGGVHYTALECYREMNGASRSYELGMGVSMNILYQKYYEESTSNENNYSVCMLLSQEDKHYLFTGDLEAAGEKSLVASNDLPKCVLYKGGHHGSDTSSSLDLLDVIEPDIVCVCSCCGDKHNFPGQSFINNVAKYTDKVYITTVKEGSTAKPLNGNITVNMIGEEIFVFGSNNSTLFKDTEWFKKNRILPDEWK